MKLSSINVQNFLGVRAVDVKLPKPIALFAGRNYAGKSSLQEAVRMALVGESVRVGLKKDYAALVTDGEESGFAEVCADGPSYAIVLPSGQGTFHEGSALPFALDAQRFAHLDADERRKFLFGLTGVGVDSKDVAERMAARGCNDTKASAVAPFLRAGFDAAHKEAQSKARECKAQWKTVTGGETYGSNKAAAWAATKPEVSTDALTQRRADLARVEGEIEAETARLGELQGRAKQAAEQSGKLDDLREKAGRYARIQDKLNRDEKELAEWQAKVEDTRRRAGSGKREGLVHDLARALNGLIDEPQPLGVERETYRSAQTALEGYEAQHGEIGAAGDPEAIAALPDYEKALHLMESSVTNGRRDLEAADAAARALRELEEGAQAEPVTDAQIAAITTRIEMLKHNRADRQATLRLLEDQARQAAQAEEKTRRAAELHQDVQEWEAVADALAPSGIPGEMLAEALEPINDRLHTSAGVAEWEQTVIHSDMRITYGLRDYALISESEKWRADAMIAEAISFLSGSRLLVLDRFDMLDLKGREDLLYWLDALAEDGEIDTALIFGTLKKLPAQLPETVSAFWLEDGVVNQLREAA